MKSAGFNWRYVPGLKYCVAALFVFLYAPLMLLVIYGFNGSSQATLWGGFSVRWFRIVLDNEDIQLALGHSLLIAISAMMLSICIGTMAALALARGEQRRGRPIVIGLILLPLIVPEIVIAMTTLVFFSALHVHLGLGNLIIAHTVFCIPFAVLPVMARLRDLDPAIENAARDLYADETRVFLRVTLPLLWPAIVSGAMLAFVSSLDDFLISMMVADAGQTTLPVYIYGMMKLGVTPEVNAISTLILSCSLLLVALSFLLVQRKARRSPAA